MEVDTYFISLLVTECCFYTFHLSILFLLIAKRNSKFEGAFYNIFRIVLVADFLSFVGSLIGQRITLITALMNFFKSSTFVPSFMTCFTPFILGIQFIGRLFMAFNRFTSIWFPLNYKTVWRKQWYTVIILLLSFLSISWRMHVNVRYTYLANGNVLLVYGDLTLQPIIKGLASGIYLITTLIAAAFNGLAFVKFYYKKRKTGNFSMNEQHLLFVSIIIFFAQLGRACYTLQQYLFPTNQNIIAFFSSVLPFLNDALALSGSISFFLLSKTARREYALFYFNKPSNLVATISKSITPTIKTTMPSTRHK